MNEANKFFREVNNAAAIMDAKPSGGGAGGGGGGGGNDLDINDFHLTDGGSTAAVPLGHVPLPDSHRKHLSVTMTFHLCV